MEIERLVYVLGAKATQFNAVMSQAEDRLKGMSSKFTAAGAGLAAAAGAMAAPLVLATRTFAGFQSEMARVRALTSATGDDFARLVAQARELGATTVYTATQSAKAMSFFALANFEVNDIMKAMRPTLNLAAAGMVDIGEAADIVVKIMGGMGVSADDLGHAVDVLTKAMTTANTDLRMLGEAFKYVGPFAKAAGWGMEEVAAAIQTMSNAGIQGTMAGTSLRMAILRLTAPTRESKDLLKALKIEVTDLSGNVRPLADLVEDLSGALGGAGSGAVLAALGILFGARAAGGMAVTAAQGAEKLREMTQALEQANGTARRIADIQMDTLLGDWIRLTSAVGDFQIAIGEQLEPALRVLVQTGKFFVGVASSIASALGPIIPIFGGLVLVVGTFGVALLAVGLAAKVGAIAIGGLTMAMGLFASVTGVATAALGGFLILLTIIAAHPVIAILTVLAAALIGLGAYFAFFRKESKGVEEANGSLEKLNTSLDYQRATLGMTSREIAIYDEKMKLLDKTVEDHAKAQKTLKEVTSKAFDLDAMEKAQALYDSTTEAVQGLTDSLELQLFTLGMSTVEAQYYAAALKVAKLPVDQQREFNEQLDRAWASVQRLEEGMRLEGLGKQITDMTAMLEDQAETFGMTQRQAALYLLTLEVADLPVDQQREFNEQLKRTGELIAELEKADAFKAFRDSIESTIRSLEDQVAAFGMTAEEAKLFKLEQELGVAPPGMQAALEEQLEYVRALTAEYNRLKGIKEEVEEADRRQNELMRRGREITKSVATPWEAYIEKMRELDALLKDQIISLETYRRKAAEYEGELAPGDGGRRDTGSVEVFRAALIDIKALGMGMERDPTVDKLSEQLREQRMHTRLLEEIAREGSPS